MGKNKRNLLLCLVLVLLVCTLVLGKRNNSQQNSVSEEIEHYMNHYMDLKQEGRIKFENSSEGGIITQYKDDMGGVLRYRLIQCGEMSQIEENYYFLDNYVYYTQLEKIYDIPIPNTPIDILYQTFREAITIDGEKWNYDKTDGKIFKSGESNVKLYSLEDLNQLYRQAELEN